MNICYLWVQKFRNFQNFQLNLSGNYKFHFDLESNNIELVFTEKLPKNFFPDRIIDVIGIIGKNGSGKTNALELVCNVLKGGKTTLNTSFFVIVKEGNDFICYHNSVSIPVPTSTNGIIFKNYNGSINPLRVVYFSNVFDERKSNFSKEVSDISVNNIYNKRQIFKSSTSSNFEKQIKLIQSKVFGNIAIETPHRVQITSRVWTARYPQINEKEIFGNDYDHLGRIRTLLRNRLRDSRLDNKFVNLLKYGFFLETINLYTRKFKDRDIFRYKRLGDISISEKRYKTDDICDELIEFISENIDKIQISHDVEEDSEFVQAIKKTKNQLLLIGKIRDGIDELSIENYIEGSRSRGLEHFSFKYNSEKTNSFVNDYLLVFEGSNLFEINWLGISSGQKAYLNLFASIYHEIRNKRQENLLICIDEGDLYLHPMWQIQFFSKLVLVLPIFFEGDIQLVLTSHSPFLLSDLPRQNLTILDNSIEGLSKNGTELALETFGGNLYNLYSDPFFLGDKKMSEFAYSKIKNLVERIERRDFKNREKEYLYRLINLIGDEVIKHYAIKLLR